MDWTVDNLDSFINDQVQNALAFYSIVENKPVVQPTIAQLQNPPSIPSQVFAPGNSGSLLVIGLVIVAVVVLAHGL